MQSHAVQSCRSHAKPPQPHGASGSPLRSLQDQIHLSFSNAQTGGRDTMQKLFCTFMLSVALAATTAASAATPKFTNLYVFGDSYCDVGNVSIATQGARPGPLYYEGRFSNGPLWVDHIASYLGVPLTPALAGGTDFAFAGA